MRNPPIMVSVIGFFALLAGFGYLFFGLRVLGFDWFGILGDLPAFESVGIWGWLAIIAGITWFVVAFGLWALQPWARFVAMVIAGLSLFEAVLAFFQFPGSGIGFAMALLPVVILLYLNSREVKDAFGEGDMSGNG
jgi:cytochrome c oxidase subunit IV